MSLLATAFLAAAFAAWPREKPSSCYLEVTVRASTSGIARFYPDINAPMDDAHCQRTAISEAPATLRFPLEDGRYLNLRLSPLDKPAATVSLSAFRIVRPPDLVVRQITPQQVQPLHNLSRTGANETGATYDTVAGPDLPLLNIELGSPLILKTYSTQTARTLLRRFLVAWVGSIIALLGAARLGGRFIGPIVIQIKERLRQLVRHPVRLIAVTGAISVIASCYPVVFFGKSFLSPNNNSHSCLLYGEMPSVPASKEASYDVMRGADMGAAIWYSWPTSVVQSRTIFHDFEIPLWNRYDLGGVPLLGQGQSMLCDPLHLLVLIAGAPALAWDLKYLAAKFLFVFCLGLCVWRLTGNLIAAIFVTASSAFLGFFGYRYSHPAFFSLCYAPSIFLCWLGVLEGRTNRAVIGWSGLIVLANWALLNSGTVKEAYTLLLAMNACGLVTLLTARDVIGRGRKIFHGSLGFGLFILVATPLWWTFLETLGKSWTVYDTGAVFQLKPGSFLGLFDDIFYRYLNSDNPRVTPSANILFLPALLWFGLSKSKVDPRNLFVGPAAVFGGALAFVFGVVPASVILHLPFISRIYHIDNTFSCVALVCLPLLVGFGVKAFCDDVAAGTYRRHYIIVLVIALVLFLGYFATNNVQPASGSDSEFIIIYLSLLVVTIVAFPWLAAYFLKQRIRGPWVISSLLLLFLFATWRHGMQLGDAFDPYVMNPKVRTNLFADSSASVRLIKSAHQGEPFRTVGLRYNFFPGYGGAIGLEQIDGPDPLLNKHYKSLMDAYGVALPFGGAHEGEVTEPIGAEVALFDMLNVRYVLGSPGTVTELAPSVRRIAALDLDVYESDKVWPRAFFTDSFIPYTSEHDFATLLKQGDGSPFAAVARTDLSRLQPVQEWAGSAVDASRRHIVPARDYVLTANRTSFKISAPAAGIVVLTEPFLEDDFQLRVNGRRGNYFRVNSAFRGIFVPAPGDYEVSYIFWPQHLSASLSISAFGLLCLLAWVRLGTASRA
jgi:hypothetical protein